MTIDNRDRDPLGLDLVDGAIAWNYGLTGWCEAYGRFIFNRSVAVPDTPVLPPPPLDEILAPGTTAPRRPFYSVYPPTPCAPPFPDRRIEWRDGVVMVTDEPLILPHRLDVGVGVRRALRPNLAAVGEATTVFDVGHRTRIVDRARPIDVLAGLQYRRRRFRVTAALRDHLHALQSMAIRPSPLAGMVDVTKVDNVDLARYLSAIGLSDAVPSLRLGVHRLLVPAPGGPPLPPGSRVIPDTYRIRSEHQMGFLLLWGMTF